MGYECFQDDGNAAAMILTNLDTGDTIGVCGAHVADWALSLLCAVTGEQWHADSELSTDPGTGDVTDDDETADGPTVPAPSSPVAVPAVDVPLPDDDQGDDDDGGDQLTEDHAVRDAELRAELGAARG